MTEDALATDNLITMIQIKSDGAGASQAEPNPIENMGCLGKIIRYERMLDGRFNLLLVGLKRVRIRTELPAKKLYRIAAAEVVEDVPPLSPESPARNLLIEQFRRGLARRQGIDPDLLKLLDSGTVELGALTDIIAYVLEIPPRLKQELLAESAVDRRVEILLRILGERGRGSQANASRSFPPPFSRN
jgi:Lon protease-like protein